MYPSCGAKTVRMLPMYIPFPQFPLARDSGGIAQIHMQSLLHSRLSPQNVPLFRASITTMHPHLCHSQHVETTLIDQSSPSRSHYDSAGGDSVHSLPLAA